MKLPRGLKPKLSKDGELCLRALLHRDATVRLGDGDAQAVKDHPCFGMVDFQGLAMRHVDPPFLPTRFVADLRSQMKKFYGPTSRSMLIGSCARMDGVMTASDNLREVRVSGERDVPRGGLSTTANLFRTRPCSGDQRAERAADMRGRSLKRGRGLSRRRRRGTVPPTA